MRQLIKTNQNSFYKINEFVVKTTPMRVHYASKNKLEKWVWQKKKKVIKNLLNSFNYQTIIDVGCGDGGIFSLTKNGCDYTGVDISATQLAAFKHEIRGRKIKKKPRLIQADVTRKIPCKDSVFDAALVCDSLEHFLNPVVALNEIKRVVKPGGRIIFSIPNEELFQLVRFFTARFPFRSPDHIFSIKVKDIKKYFPKVITVIGVPLSLFFEINLINVILAENEK